MKITKGSDHISTEKEFLKEYKQSEYECPSVTSDIAAFTVRFKDGKNYRQNAEGVLQILMIKRKGHPYQGCWALPGGFLSPGETIEECALREAKEETGVIPKAIMPDAVYSDPGRDPRGWIISHSYISILCDRDIKATAGDDASEALWFDISLEEDNNGNHILTLKNGDTKIVSVLSIKRTQFAKTEYNIKDNGMLAFDHAKIIASALTTLRHVAKDFEIIFDFLPDTFTLNELQKIQETILDTPILPANFRRKVSPYVEETDEYISGAGHRPAKLFRRKR